MKNVFNAADAQQIVERINQLTPETKPQWGTMNVGQVLAHCCVTYETVYTDKHPKPGAMMKFMLKLFVKNGVIGPKPYPHNGRTAPYFKITDEREFATEKKRLVDFIQKTQQLGADHFNNKESLSFGPLTTDEWNVLFYKHLDHHLRQFGV